MIELEADGPVKLSGSLEQAALSEGVKCKGCDGRVWMMKATEAPDGIGGAIHFPMEYCQWFADLTAYEIAAYYNVTTYKEKRGIK